MMATRRLVLAVGVVLSLVALSGCVPPPAPPDPLVSCDSLEVSATYSPPATTGADDVTGTVEPGSGLSGCTDRTGRGVTGATLAGSFDVEGACATHAPDEEWARGTGQLNWSDGSVSQYAASLVGWTFLRIEIRITGGLWAGATASVPVAVTDAVGTCSGAGTSQVVIEGGPFVLHPAGSPGSSPLLGVEKIDAGGSHTCALVSGGKARCWGSNSDGQIGNGGSGALSREPAPVDVVGLGPASEISAGSSHTCALVTGGEARCWGDNTLGQLGDGTTTSSDVPVAVAGMSGATSISAGITQTCAIVAGGAVACWGNGSPTPTTVPGISGATAVSVGDLPNMPYLGPYACAVVGGGVECWGNNSAGQLGDGTVTSSATPVSVVGITGATAVGGGPYGSTCAVVGGGVECWGSNTWGELGDGTTSAYSTVPVSALGVTGATEAGQGVRHACAGISDGSAMCWGHNDRGQLGTGSTLAVNPPASVDGLADATSVSVGHDHNCAVRAGGTAVCWGRNDSGQLGSGNLSDSAAPVTVIRGL